MNELKELLKTLVAYQTVPGDESSMHQALDFIADFVSKRGMHVARFDSSGYESLVATVRPEHKTPKVMLAAHLDVVPAADELFNLRESDGKLYGRGVLDMKFAIAAYLHLIDELQGQLEEYDIGLMITTDEEIGGMHGTAQLIKEGYVPDVCVLPDGGDNWQVQVHAKGFLTIRITTYGTPAHASRPWLGKNAFEPLFAILHEVEELFPGNSERSNTYNLGRIDGGTAANQVADRADAFIDMRFVSEKAKIQLAEEIAHICKKYDADIQVEIDGATCEFDLQNIYIAPFAQLVSDITGIEVTGAYALGGSDARFYAEIGVPCVSLYPTGGGHHGPEEWIDTQALYQFKDILRNYLDIVARTAPDETPTASVDAAEMRLTEQA